MILVLLSSRIVIWIILIFFEGYATHRYPHFLTHPCLHDALPISRDGSDLPLPKQTIRLCSRNRPTMLFTRMFSDSPGTPGLRQQMPRTIRSMATPACEAL